MVLQTHSAYYFSVKKTSKYLLSGNIQISLYFRSHFKIIYCIYTSNIYASNLVL